MQIFLGFRFIYSAKTCAYTVLFIIIIYLIICRNSHTQPSRVLKQLPAAICRGMRDKTELLMWSFNYSNARFEHEIVSELQLHFVLLNGVWK